MADLSGTVPNVGQVGLLLVSAALFAGEVVTSLARRWGDSPRLRGLARFFGCSALLVGAGVLVWHSLDRRSWLPFGDNFDSLVSLALLLAGFVMYVQWKRPIGGLDWFMVPLVVLLLLGAAIFGRTKPHTYFDDTWGWFHNIFSFGAAVALLVAGALGAMYLVNERRLRSRPMLSEPAFATAGGSLERLEHLTFLAVTLGFAMFTVSMIMGLARIFRSEPTTQVGLWSPKVLLGVGAWVAYAIVLHTPINPSFRGRKVAWASVIGLLLLIGTIVATQFATRSENAPSPLRDRRQPAAGGGQQVVPASSLASISAGAGVQQ